MSLVDRVVFSSATLRIGLFRCPPAFPGFTDTGPIDGHLVVFPRTGVTITHAGGPPIVADPNVVMFYNDQQIYRRGKLSHRGDLCEWFAFAPAAIADAIRPFDSAVENRAGQLFTLTHGLSEAQSYLLQRLVVAHVLGGQVDPVYVDETMLTVLAHVVAGAYRARGSSPRGPAGRRRAGAALAHDVQALLARSFGKQLSLDEIARAVHSSSFHLCRVFRASTGMTIHAYLNQIRLRTALEFIAEGYQDLAALGIELGYSSHSHFTQAFRHAFGTAPSELRRGVTARRIHGIRKNLIV
jgi:AraC family transcriptional regulator